MQVGASKMGQVTILFFCNLERCVLFCSLAILDPRVGHTMVYFLHLYLSSVILIDSFTYSPVYVLMLSIHTVHSL